MHVWDLRLIRKELKELGLDWDWPEFSPAGTPRQIAEPVHVDIRGVEKGEADSLISPHLKPRPTSGS